MMIKYTENDTIESLYKIWKRASEGRKYTSKRTLKEFKYHFVGSPSSDNRYFFLEKDGGKIGALLVESYNWGSYIHDWIYERDHDILQDNFQKIISTFEEGQRLYLYPVFGKSDITDDYKKIGFKKNKIAPYHLLMKKDLKKVKNIPVKDGKIDVLTNPNSNNKVENLSELILKISSRWKDIEKIKEEIYWGLEENMKYYLLCKNDKIFAYAGVEKMNLFSGERTNWINEVGVHPEHRRKGFASTILQYIINKSNIDDKDSVLIDTHSKNPAIKLYKKLDFRTIEKFPNLFFESQ